MLGLMRRDPDDLAFHDLFTFRKSFDDVMERLWGALPAARVTADLPPAESYIEDGKFHLKLQTPGLDPKNVTIEVHGDQLHITGEQRQESESKTRRYLTREFSYGAFERWLPLPEGVKPEQIEASYKKGLLEIIAPVSEKSVPRKIEVKTLPEEAPKKPQAA